MSWFAVYTNPRSEKKAHALLLEKGIDAYLPLQRTLKQWSDRKKWVEEPLFRSYLFVNIPPDRYFDVLNTNGVVRYITFEGKAVPVPSQQIEAVRMFLESGETGVEDSGRYLPGQPVEVVKGPLKGLSGELVQLSGRHKVRVEIGAVGQSIMVTIPVNQLRVVK